jgi:hypothetical protein
VTAARRGPAPGSGDPYRRCGLAANPFAHDAPGGEAAGWVDRGLPAAAGAGGHRLVQVIGVKGAGKTSTLRRWHAAVPGPWRYVPPGVRRLRAVPVAPLVYWDEADRIPVAVRWWAFRTAARRGATIVAGTHLDLAREARAAGLAVDTVELAPVTPGELTAWAAGRFAAVGAGPQWSLPEPVAADVAARCGASWRSAGDLLHAWVAREVAARS